MGYDYKSVNIILWDYCYIGNKIVVVFCFLDNVRMFVFWCYIDLIQIECVGFIWYVYFNDFF